MEARGALAAKKTVRHGPLPLSESTWNTGVLRNKEKGKGRAMRSAFHFTLFGAGLLALTVAALVAPTALGSRAVAPTCTASQLKGSLLDSQGAAGTILFSVTLKNSGAACSLKGYPSLRLKGAHGLLRTHVDRGGLAVLNSTPRRVKLKHLGRASVLVSYSDVPVGSESSCPHGKALRLRPPGVSDWLTVRVSTYACTRGTLHESPVLAGIRHAA